MKISYSYRGVKTELESEFSEPKIGTKGKVKVRSIHWSDGNRKLFTVTIEPHELFATAEKCLQQLNSIAGTNYKIFNQVK